ncbi:MAG: hypothetical protein KBD66_03775 [Candidatus Doudnabacteria bacterium]|nr:hypothetical protein [Candidatus Doudnabacteria bacterium]
MALVPEKRGLPAEAIPAIETMSDRSAALTQEVPDLVAPAEVMPSEGEAMMAETRLQLQDGSGGVNANGQEVAHDPATVVLFPDAAQRAAFEMQTPEARVFTLLHARTAVSNPGATIDALRGLSQAA